MKLKLIHSYMFVVLVVLVLIWFSGNGKHNNVCSAPAPAPVIRVVLASPPTYCQHQQEQHPPQNMPYRRRIYSGVPQHYTSIGYLKREVEVEPSERPPRCGEAPLYPLFGRASLTNSQRWNYHTTTNGHYGNIRLPIFANKTDCTRDLGCQELYDGDTVTIPGVHGTFRVQLYSSDFY